MKTEYERMYKYEVNSWFFGKPKKRFAAFYVVLGFAVPLVYAIVSILS